jgi:hypothetical protein
MKSFSPRFALGTFLFSIFAIGSMASCKLVRLEESDHALEGDGASEETEQPQLDLAQESTQSVQTSQNFQNAIVTVFASHYQSCAPILNPNADPKSTIQKFLGKPESHAIPSQCKNRLSDDLDYVSFGKGTLEPDAGQMKISEGQIFVFQQYNCSGFLAATMASGGHKYYRAQQSHEFSPRTSDMDEIFKRKDNCFVKPKLSKEVSILPGDVINVSNGHVIRVLAVGEDPLGFSQVNTVSDCKRISKKNMNFLFAHSSSEKNSSGNNGVRVEHASNSSTSIIQKLAALTKKMCEKSFKKGTLSGILPDQKVGTVKYGWGYLSIERDQIFALRRHVGNTVEGCSFEPLKAYGESCLDPSCYRSVSEMSF